jgi:ABC-type methionine transport system permease subunit
VQRQRDRRRLDPYPPQATSRSASSRSWACPQEQAQEKFGFLLDAFKLRRAAARRHRLRLGPDRACCSGGESIRDVIAFPKSGGGYDPLTGARRRSPRSSARRPASTLGLTAGFLGGKVDKVISFITDFFLTVPFLLAALTLAPIINQRFSTSEHYFTIQRFVLIGVLAIFGWMGIARIIRGEVLSLREREFVQAARVLGMPTSRIMIKELLPNLAAPLIIASSLLLPGFVAAEAGLAYLGIGVTSGASWGQTIDKATRYFDNYPLYLYEPMIGIVLLVLSLNLLGDAIRDALDPKTRR